VIESPCTLAADAAEARKFLDKQPFDLALCDVNMPGESGIDLARHIASEYEDTAVIILTAVDDPKTADAAIEAGTYGYIIKPFNPNELIINIRNALRRRKLEIASRMYRQDLEQMVKERTVRLQGALEGIIQAMTRTVESRDPYTAGHQHRVADLAVVIAMEMNLPKDQIEGIRMGGKIHDLGKISVPAEILSKPSRLTEIEFALIKTHPMIGYEIIADIEFPWPIAQMILQHHEKMNGSGYPQGLSGEDILLEARILCVADVVEAMASHRPYRPALGIEKALDEISKNKGVFYDPEVVDALLRLKISEIEKILR
jgi:response regulator RpfG family c-di-GMP phosphodiesterase